MEKESQKQEPKKERRRSERQDYPGAQIICYLSDAPKTSNPYNVALNLVDINLGGACVLASGKLAPGAEVVVDIYFPRHQANLHSHCEVRWSKEVQHKRKKCCLAGLEFQSKPECTGAPLSAILGLRESEDAAPPAKPEQRRAVRVPMDVNDIICVPEGLFSSMGLGKNVGQRLLDVSRTGARIEVLGPIKEGKKVRVRVQIPAVGEILETRAEVAWVKPVSGRKGEGRRIVGIKFGPMPVKSRQILFALDRWYKEKLR